MKKRIEYFDTAKGIGVVLVLLGHLQGQEFFQFSPLIIPMCEWIFSFHMPFFFIISGMLIAYKNETDKDFKDIAKRRFRGIMIPYYWFSFFYMTVVIAAFIKKQILIGTVWLNLWYVFSTYGMNVLWFLPALFFGELLFILIIKKAGEKTGAVIFALQGAAGFVIAYFLRKGNYNTTIKEGAHQFVTALTRPFIACLFIAIGYFAFKYIIGKKDITKASELSDTEIRNKVQINAKEIAVAIALLILGASFVWVNHGVDFRSMVFKNVLAYFLCSLSTSFGLILLCKNMKPLRLLKFFGVNSLVFMATHGSETVTYHAMRLAMWANQYLTTARGYICYSIIVCVILVYVSIMILLINKFAPFILGRPFKIIKLKESAE